MELFKTWKKNMVLYGLQSQIGAVYRNSDRTTSFYDVGNFLYLAGEVNSRDWHLCSCKNNDALEDDQRSVHKGAPTYNSKKIIIIIGQRTKVSILKVFRKLLTKLRFFKKVLSVLLQ